MASDSDTSLPSDLPERGDAAQEELNVAYTKGSSITAGDVSGTGIAIGSGAQANVTITEEQAYNVDGLDNPYLGLAAFTYADSNKYAGREEQIQEAIAKLTTPGEQRTLLFVTGASGSGKSSFVRAGVLPALEQHYQPGIQVRIVEDIRPSQRPLDRLFDALQRRAGLPANAISASALPDSFYGFLARHTTEFQVNLLVIDQFEELFSQSDPGQRDALLDILTNLPPFHAIRTHILVTVRVDYLPELFQHAILYRQVKSGIDLRTMTKTELRKAILRPLERHPQANANQKRFESSLLDKLVSDASPKATYLPLLQVTLEDLWRRGTLKAAAYSSLTDAMHERAEQLLKLGSDKQPRSLTEQQVVLQIFLALVDVSLDDDTRRDVRRRRTMAELSQGHPEHKRLIDQLVEARLLSKDVEERDGYNVEVVDVIHESLIHNWQRLQFEIAAQRDILQRRKRFETALKEWIAKDRSNAYLLTGIHLAEAETLAEHADIALRLDAAAEFYTRSINQRDDEQQRALAQEQALRAEAEARVVAEARARQEADARTADQRSANVRLRRRSRWIAVTALVATLFAVAAALFGTVAQQREAEALSSKERAEAEMQRANAQQVIAVAEQQRAEYQAQVAQDRALSSIARSMISTYPQRALLLAVAALSTNLRVGEPPDIFAEQVLWESLLNSSGVGLSGQTRGTNNLRFSNSGDWLAASSEDGTVRLWDTRTSYPPQLVAVLSGHGDGVNILEFSPDEQWLITVGYRSGDRRFFPDPNLKLWKLETINSSSIPTILSGPKAGIYTATFSDDSRWLAAAGDDTTVHLWDLSKNNLASQSKLLTGHRGGVFALAFSPDNRILATGGDAQDGTVRLWDVTSPDPTQSLEILNVGNQGVFYNLQFSQDSKWLAARSGRSILIWQLQGKQISNSAFINRSEAENLFLVGFDPDNAHVIMRIGPDSFQSCELQAVVDGQERCSTKKTPSTGSGFALDSNHERLAQANQNTVYLIDWKRLSENSPHEHDYTKFLGAEDDLSIVTFSPDGKYLATAGNDTSIRLWPLSPAPLITGSTLFISDQDTDRLLSAVSHDRRWLATNSKDGKLLLKKISPDGAVLEEHILNVAGDNPRGVALEFSSDGAWLALSLENKTLQLWRLPPGANLDPSLMLGSASDRVELLSFSPNGRWLATRVSADAFIGRTRTSQVWDLLAADPTAHPITIEDEAMVSALAFSTDSHWLATATVDGAIYLRDLTGPSSQQIVWTLRGHKESIESLEFSPDGKWLASGSTDKTAMLWDLTATNPDDSGRLLRTQGANVDRGESVIVRFSNTGRWLATGSDDSLIRLVDLTQEDPLQNVLVLRGHDNTIISIAFHPRDEKMITVSNDNDGTTLRIWKLTEANMPSIPLEVAGYYLHSAFFLGDNLSIISLAFHDYPRVWQTDVGHLSALACRVAGRNFKISEWEQFFPEQPYVKVCPDHPLHSSYFKTAGRLARAGAIIEAQELFQSASRLDPGITPPAEFLNALCRFGYLYGEAVRVLEACEQAIRLAPDNGRYYESRGIAYALTGNVSKAVEDLRHYVNWSKDNYLYQQEEYHQEQWAKQLEAGNNPFERSTLESLLDQELEETRWYYGEGD